MQDKLFKNKNNASNSDNNNTSKTNLEVLESRGLGSRTKWHYKADYLKDKLFKNKNKNKNNISISSTTTTKTRPT